VRAEFILGATLVLSGVSIPSVAVPNAISNYTSDPIFLADLDIYWRTRLLGAYAGSRVCSLPNSAYDDPKSVFRPIQERLQRATVKFEARFPGALKATARPYEMPPPQTLCEDAKAAQEAIFAFETSVVGLEYLLDQRSVR